MTVKREKVLAIWLVWTPNSRLANRSPALWALGWSKRGLQRDASLGHGI